MTPVSKAIWFIESHFDDDINLQTIADMSHVSRHHLVRAFGTATGYSVMRYVRARRLSFAAETLATGAPNILDVALDAGYNSHEAFTRAFCNQFGITPEAVREQGHLKNINLVEVINMSQQTYKDLPKPRIEQTQVKHIAGTVERYNSETRSQIPSQWGRYNAQFAPFNGLVGEGAYGVVYDGDDEGNFLYMCGMEVREDADLPDDYQMITIPQRQYIVYQHTDHISDIHQTWMAIWNKALPDSDYEVTSDPTFEYYGTDFDPQTGMGGVDLWIPVDNK